MARILVVEDEPMIAALLAEWLQELGHAVAGPFATAAEGVAEIDSGDIDAALIDLNLRGGDSYPVAARLRAADLPFAFASGGGRESLADPFRTAPVLAKPYAFDEVEALLGAWGLGAAAD